MKHQKVVVDVWKMIFHSGSYLSLAFLVWLFLKLAYACVWFPRYLQKQDDEEADQLPVQAENETGKTVSTEGDDVDCKKNV